MYNEKIRKLTSLMLMTVMVAGGMTFAFPGFMPTANAAAEELYVSAQEVGNFAGIQVIEIVVSDPNRSSTDESEGIPGVEINNKDVLMTQADDGSWYAYVANEIAIEKYNAVGGNDITDIYKQERIYTDLSGSDAVNIYNATTAFLDGYKNISPADGSGSLPDNNPNVNDIDWPFIQSYDIGNPTTRTAVTITYGQGGTQEVVQIDYEYDDNKDITLDRQQFPENAYVHISLDDSLLNLSPTADELWAFSVNGSAYYITDVNNVVTSKEVNWASIGFEEGPFVVSNLEGVFNHVDTNILDEIKETAVIGHELILLKTSNLDENLFVNYDNADKSGLQVVQNGESYIEYNSKHSILFDTFKGSLSFIGPAIEEWLSGVEIEVILTDEDRNLNSRNDESMGILEGEVPYIKIGSPITIDSGVLISNGTANSINSVANTLTDSKTEKLTLEEATVIIVNATWPTTYTTAIDNGYVFPYVNYDFTAFGGPQGTFFAGNTTGFDNVSGDSDNSPDSKVTVLSDGTSAKFQFDITDVTTTTTGTVYFDLFFYGQLDAVADNTGKVQDNIVRVNDAFYRFALEETDDNTAKFEGTLEYMMINQLNVFDKRTYDSIEAADDNVVIIVNDDMDGADAVTVSYGDIGVTNQLDTISVQEDANTHTGVIALDSESYSSGNTIEVILIDVDLNTDSDTIQTYDVDPSREWVGDNTVWLSQLKINGILFDDRCSAAEGKNLGLSDTGFTLTETGDATGIFVGTLQLPTDYCVDADKSETTNGLKIEFEYQDYSDSSGESNETSESATIKSNTGSVKLDSTVYPVPFGPSDYNTYGSTIDFLEEGAVIVTIQVNDPDFNINANGEDKMSTDVLTLEISRGSLNANVTISDSELVETDPQSGIFEVDVRIADIDYEFEGNNLANQFLAINQGDILIVTYTDPNDASGDSNTVTDSATFDLRNAVLQTDKKEYVIGSDAIITLIEPDLNLDSDSAETWSLNLINWDSDAGDRNLIDNIFDANPAGFRETGDNTGIFQTVIEIPRKIGTDALERGELITLEYQDNGPAGADFIGDDDEDISVQIRTSSYGASVSLDQKVYTWTDKIYITIVSPDHNFDNNAIDEIGATDDNEINIGTRTDKLKNYKLVETGPDTGIFTGEVILTGFAAHDADGDGNTGDASGLTSAQFSGPTNGQLESSDDDGISVSFESSDGETVIGSALVRWNIGETQWLEASYPASGGGVVRIIDPDMNWKPESVDSFDITVWSDSSLGGVELRVTETNEATGIFEGTVSFTTTQSSSGSRLHVEEGDAVTAEYEDHTLPDPYNTGDTLSITAVTNIGTMVPPLERAPAGNLRAVDAFDNTMSTILVDQQVQVEADIHNGQDRDQKFAYLVQIQDKNGVTVSLAWITGILTPGQNFTPALSWVPAEVGDYKATAFVWESITNPTALSPPISTILSVG